MKGAFGQEISDSYQAVFHALETYRADQIDENAKDENAKALRDLCIAHLKSNPRIAEVCPALGVLHALARLGYLRLWVVQAMVGAFRIHPQLWKIAGWNDFEMAAWMVDHDPYYTARIYKRLYETKGLVNETCAWMVNSIRQQEPEFAAQWSEVNTGFPPPRRAGTPGQHKNQ
jgi:hypothetical protein